MLIRFSLITISLFFILLSCKNEAASNNDQSSSFLQLKEYYYPVNDLEKGLVYLYENEALNNQAEYWLHKTVYDEASNQYLVSTQYNIFFNQNQMIREWIVADGSLVKDYRFFQEDSISGRSVASKATINQNIRFPFKAVKSDSLAYRFNLDFIILPDSSTAYNITVDRSFDKFLKYPWKGDSLDAVQIKCKEFRSMQNNTEGGAFNNESTSVEIYAKGLGLVYKDSDSKIFPYKIRLTDRISMEEFEALQKEN